MARDSYRIFDADTHIIEPVEPAKRTSGAPIGPSSPRSAHWSSAHPAGAACPVIEWASVRS